MIGARQTTHTVLLLRQVASTTINFVNDLADCCKLCTCTSPGLQCSSWTTVITRLYFSQHISSFTILFAMPIFWRAVTTTKTMTRILLCTVSFRYAKVHICTRALDPLSLQPYKVGFYTIIVHNRQDYLFAQGTLLYTSTLFLFIRC